MKSAKSEFPKLFKLFTDCKKQLPLLAKELGANSYRTSFSFKQDNDEEPQIRCNVNLSFGQYSNYSCGSYVNLSHPFAKAEITLREYHKEWLKEETKKQNVKKIEEEKERIYQEYLKNTKKF